MNAKQKLIPRPGPDEYPPYCEKYVALITGNDILAILEDHCRQMAVLFGGRGERDGGFRYALEKWTVKEVLGHVSDTERVFAYRALRIARNDKTPLATFEQDDFVRYSPCARGRLADLVEEFTIVRRATLALLRPLDEDAWLRRGTASGFEVSVRGVAYMIAGHELHHRRILEERYFPAIPRA